ncbi:hypothetical protein HYR54_04285 [Candidatus Acetothermia bacterium]|nr:hypothetical protein [Candidatus Acetothermia bacterium]MBI3459672.1 hypothetical protein [Candidatus Acetothermia bacterium]MBI3660028.1 hypothetical protein [Candidatus Acetothermia bacterium]
METEDSNRLLYWTAGLSIAAALIHAGVAPEHLSEWWGYGIFFLVAGICQGIYGLVLLLRPWRYDDTGGLREGNDPSYVRTLYMLGIIGNGAIIILYLITRFVGIPFLGPDAGKVEPFTPISVLSKLIELATIVCLVLLMKHSKQQTG